MDKALYILAGFDDATEARLAGIQNALYDAGFVGSQTKGIPMHVTLGAFSTDRESELAALLESLSHEVEGFDVSLSHVGIFGGSRVLFAAPDASHELLALHERIDPSDDRWTPHATLLIDEPEVVQAALPLVMREFEPMRGRLTTLYLYEFQPPRFIKSVELK